MLVFPGSNDPTSLRTYSGWMLEYQFEVPLAVIDEPIISLSWTFKEARNIENLMTEEENRQLVERLLAA
jgi:hypothetical protein